MFKNGKGESCKSLTSSRRTCTGTVGRRTPKQIEIFFSHLTWALRPMSPESTQEGRGGEAGQLEVTVSVDSKMKGCIRQRLTSNWTQFHFRQRASVHRFLRTLKYLFTSCILYTYLTYNILEMMHLKDRCISFASRFIFGAASRAAQSALPKLSTVQCHRHPGVLK